MEHFTLKSIKKIALSESPSKTSSLPSRSVKHTLTLSIIHSNSVCVEAILIEIARRGFLNVKCKIKGVLPRAYVYGFVCSGYSYSAVIFAALLLLHACVCLSRRIRLVVWVC